VEQPNTLLSRLPMTLGLDLGDRRTSWCLVGDSGVVARGSARTDQLDLTDTCRHAITRGAERVVMEVSTHSPWVSRLAESVIPDVVVANAHAVGKILESTRKSDRRDAEMLARLGRADIELLRPIQHRGAKAQADLSLLRSRAQLIAARTSLVNHVRGACKAVGVGLPDCSTEAFHKAVPSEIPSELKTAQGAVLSVIEHLTAKIKELDREVAGMCKSEYPETTLLTQVAGVGPICSLTFVLTVEEPDRIVQTRNVGAYFGLVPKRSQSGDRDPELHISKCGDADMRRLLVSSAQYILGPFGPDTDLRRFGKRLEKKGGKSAKRRAVVAVARKLAVLLLSLWRSGQEYIPLKNGQATMA
jgi:transposase